MIVLGIDIGLDGAIAALDLNQACVEDMPTKPEGERRRIDALELFRTLRRMVPSNRVGMIVFEQISSGQGRGGHSQASLMQSAGIVKAVADMTGWPSYAIQPVVWKRHFGLLKAEKDASRELAQRLFPQLAAELVRVKDTDRAEALLISLYARGRWA
jgi:hypothetical protein